MKSKLTPELKQILEEKGYTNLVEKENVGICGLYRFIFNVGLVYGINETGYNGKYCYSTKLDAAVALLKWDGIGDPDDEHWTKHKGGVEYKNPKCEY